MSQPALVTYLELNRRYGHGYQGRIVMEGILESVIDSEPFTLDEAYNGCVYAVEQINKELGYHYVPYEITPIARDDINANKRTDFTTTRVSQDIEKGHGELAVPMTDMPDIQRMLVDGKQQDMLSTRGAVLLTYAAVREDTKNTKAKAVMMKYCEYLAWRGYGKSANDIFAELVRKDKESAQNWIKATFGQYINEQMDLARYMFGLLDD